MARMIINGMEENWSRLVVVYGLSEEQIKEVEDAITIKDCEVYSAESFTDTIALPLMASITIWNVLSEEDKAFFVEYYSDVIPFAETVILIGDVDIPQEIKKRISIYSNYEEFRPKMKYELLNAHGKIKKNKRILGEFVNIVRKKKDLELCFRGNDNAVNIYCNNLTVWKIYDKDNKGEYKVEVSLHKSIDEAERKRIATILKEKLKFNSFEKNGSVRRYPYIKRTSVDKDFVEHTYDLLIPMIHKYFYNGKHLEKIRQQEIFSALTCSDTGFYVYDMEQQQKGEKKEGQNLSDMMAIRYKEGHPVALSLIEVKSTEKACKDVESGIIPHLNGMDAYIQKVNMHARKKEACKIINAYRTLRLHNVPSEAVKPEMIKDFDIVLILTDEAINYYRIKESDICDHIKNSIKNKCEIYEWNLARILKHDGKLKA